MNLSSRISARITRTVGATALSLVIMFGVMAATPNSSYAAYPVTRGGTALIANSGGDTIRVRSGAGTSFDQVAEAHEGEAVSILDGPAKDSDGNTWYKVSAPGGSGWVITDYLQGKPVAITRGGKATITNTGGDPIRVRSGAGTSFDQVAEAHEGEAVSILDGPAKDSDGNTWYKVSAPGGSGWVITDYLQGVVSSANSKSSNNSSAKPQATATKQSAAPSGPKLTGFARVGNSQGDPVRLRSAANSNGSIIAMFSPNTSVAIKQGPVVDSDSITWYQVSGNGQTGWMMAQYLIQADAPPAPPPSNTPAAQPVVVNKAPEPAKPVATAAPAVAAPAATAAPATPVAPAPTPTAAPAATVDPARSGTSRGAQQPATAPASQGNAIVSTALKYVGAYYVYGGTGPRGFDCSGFVYYIMNHSGVSMSRDMYAQWSSGPHISSSNLQPGDIVFFSNTYKSGLSHVGIYIGNGRFVHAENESTGVTISDLWSSYYSSHYSGAVRPSN